MLIIKRDGRTADFNLSKIIDAILAAFKSVDGTLDDYAVTKASNIAEYIKRYGEALELQNEQLTVEDIQDLVERGLMATKRKDVAKAYIIYRDERTRERSKRSVLIREVGEKIAGSNVQNQNANVDEASFGGRRGEATNSLMKQYALDYMMSVMARNNHISNVIYTHDLDSYAVGMHNCLSVPFDDLLAKGFKTRQTDVRPANSVNTAFQLVAVIFQLQSLQQFGGVSATHLDWTMVPYIRKSFYKHWREYHEFYTDGFPFLEEKKAYATFLPTPETPIDDKDTYLLVGTDKAYQYALKKTERECQQAVEGMYHNLNTLQSRSGNQLPFTSINYGTCTLPEGRMVTKALLEGCIKGVGAHHQTSIFPCGIFQCMKGINRKPGDPNYDLYRLALESTSKRLYPNYANVDWSGNTGYDKNDPRTYFSTMGCRTANGWDANGFGQLKDGRGNIAPVTIILPTIAMEAKELVDDLNKDGECETYESVFMHLLNQKIEEAKEQLIERFELIASQPVESAKFMYENGTMVGYMPERGIRSALMHGTLAIGQLGLAETLEILIGCNHTAEEGMELARRIEQLFKDRCAEFKKEIHTAVDCAGDEYTYYLNFGVYYTPAENLCYTAMKKFKKKYGIINKVSDHEYFTNSIHVPVWEEISPFDKIDIESQLTGYSSAGCITYVELDGGMSNNLDALETLVNYAMDKDIPYFAINIPNDNCTNCGATGEFNDCCPECGSRAIQRLRRVTGYLSTDYHHFNLGKQQEVENRFRHSQLRRM